METFKYIEGGTTLSLDKNKCTGCGMCPRVCPHAVLEMKDKKAEIVRRDRCMECGACAMNCPADALSVRPGVGCASAVIASWFPWRKNTAPSCNC